MNRSINRIISDQYVVYELNPEPCDPEVSFLRDDDIFDSIEFAARYDTLEEAVAAIELAGFFNRPLNIATIKTTMNSVDDSVYEEMAINAKRITILDNLNKPDRDFLIKHGIGE